MDRITLLSNFRDFAWSNLEKHAITPYLSPLAKGDGFNLVITSRYVMVSNLCCHHIALRFSDSVPPSIATFSEYEKKFTELTMGSSENSIVFRSYNNYFLLDCNVLSNQQKKSIAASIRMIARQKTVSGKKHVFVLLNIQELGSVVISSLKNVFESMNDNIILVCGSVTNRIEHRALGTVVHYRLDHRALLLDYFTTMGDSKMQLVFDQLWQTTHQDMIHMLLLSGETEPITSACDEMHDIVSTSMSALMKCDPKKAYQNANGFTSFILSSCIPFPEICLQIIKSLTDSHPSRVHRIIEIVSQAQVTHANSNKMLFVIDKMLLDLYHLCCVPCTLVSGFRDFAMIRAE